MPAIRTRTVDPRKLHIPDVRIDSEMTPDQMAQFVRSIRELGVLEPPMCIEADGELVVVNGKHRTLAAIEAGLATIQVNVRQGTLAQVLVENLAASVLQGRPNPQQILQVIHHLTTEEHLDSEQISAQTGLSRDYVEDFQLIDLAGDPVRDAYQRELIGKTIAVLLSQEKDEELRSRVCEQAIVYRLTAKDVRDVLKEAKAARSEAAVPQVVTTAPPPQLVVCALCAESEQPERISHHALCFRCTGDLPALRKQLAR